ncbi:MAG: hypothetical protein ACLFR6_04805 [Salinarchaeum sp.]
MAEKDLDLPADRESPVGAPVVRGNEAVAGDRAEDAIRFDPDDPDSLERATVEIQTFAEISASDAERLSILRGAAACAALVRGEGSYKAAAKRTDVPVSFIRKWARVHDLPRAVRVTVADGALAPTAAKHIARLEGPLRYDLTWATLQHDLSVREVRTLASALKSGDDPDAVFAAHGIDLCGLHLECPRPVYRELHRRAALEERPIEAVIADAIDVTLSEGEVPG